MNSRCIPLHVVHTNVQKLVQTYCGPRLLQLIHLLFSGSLRRPRIIRSFFSSSLIRLAIPQMSQAPKSKNQLRSLRSRPRCRRCRSEGGGEREREREEEDEEGDRASSEASVHASSARGICRARARERKREGGERERSQQGLVESPAQSFALALCLSQPKSLPFSFLPLRNARERKKR